MTAHVAPHRWADAWAGQVTDEERAEMERHAESCSRCARARARVKGASDSFQAIRTLTSPELPWDSVRARVHWSVSTARRLKLRPRRWVIAGWATLAAAGTAALAVALATDPIGRIDRLEPAPIVDGAQPPAPAPTAPRGPEALAGLVNRATGDVMIDGLRPDDLFARRLAAGSVLATGDGRVDIQFADGGAFAVGPRSMLELRRFDAAAIELVIDGTVDIEVGPRTAQQRFTVIAGDRTIEVRGTQFAVRHDAAKTVVACRHGVVRVRDAHGVVDVGAARRLDAPARRPVADLAAVPLSAAELDALVEATPMTLPLWNLEALLAGSAPLEIATVGRRDIRVDGVELGRAPMRVRVMPGRHTVEAADGAGRFQRAGWVDVAAPGVPSRTRARLEVLAEPPPTRDVSERRRQLKTGLDRGRLAACVRSIAKQGLAGTYVQIELAVDGSGAIGMLNILDTDLGKSAAGCVERVLRDVRFGTGAAATWRERIDL